MCPIIIIKTFRDYAFYKQNVKKSERKILRGPPTTRAVQNLLSFSLLTDGLITSQDVNVSFAFSKNFSISSVRL